MNNRIESEGDSVILPGVEGLAPPRTGSVWMRPVEALAAMLLVAIIGLLLMGVISRYVFSLPIIWIDEVASISFLWLAMLGAAMAVDRSEHLRLTLFVGMLPERLQGLASTLAMLLVAVFLGVMLRPAYEYAVEEAFITSAALNIPMSFRAAALPVGIGLMLVLAVVQAVRDTSFRRLIASIVVIAVAVGLLWLAMPVLKSFGNWNIAIFLVGFVALFLTLGVPIAFCFGLGTLAFLTFTTSVPVFVMIGRIRPSSQVLAECSQ